MTKTPEITKERIEELMAEPKNFIETIIVDRDEFQEICQLALQAMNAKMPDDRFVDIARDLESEILALRNQLAKKDEMLDVARKALTHFARAGMFPVLAKEARKALEKLK